jgi:hypothetical protein
MLSTREYRDKIERLYNDAFLKGDPTAVGMSSTLTNIYSRR